MCIIHTHHWPWVGTDEKQRYGASILKNCKVKIKREEKKKPFIYAIVPLLCLFYDIIASSSSSIAVYTLILHVYVYIYSIPVRACMLWNAFIYTVCSLTTHFFVVSKQDIYLYAKGYILDKLSWTLVWCKSTQNMRWTWIASETGAPSLLLLHAATTTAVYIAI